MTGSGLYGILFGQAYLKSNINKIQMKKNDLKFLMVMVDLLEISKQDKTVQLVTFTYNEYKIRFR